VRFSTFTLLISAATAINAHFYLVFPPPRGVFNATNEVNFCGTVNYNYVDAVDNRSGGFVRHSPLTRRLGDVVDILMPTVQGPASFGNFTSASGQQQSVRNFANAT
ncbi:hypothetical protein BJV78DRAFT_1308111, partial [Lactifluus subvellereus]